MHAPLQDLWLLEMDSLDWEEVELEKLDRRQEKQLPKRLVNMIISCPSCHCNALVGKERKLNTAERD